MVEVSSLSSFTLFDIVENVSIDGMHCIYAGITKMLLGLWFDTTHHKQLWYCGRKVGDVDERLLSIHPPLNITKTPRSLKDRKFWKSKL